MNALTDNRSSKIDDARDFKPGRLKDWTDQELFVRFLRDRDAACYAILYERLWNQIRECVGKAAKDHFHAEDVAEEVFLVLWKEPQKLEGIRNLKSYLGRMAIHRAIDLTRKEGRFELTGVDAEVNGANAFAPGASWTGEAKAEFWEDIRSCLTQAQFRMIELRYRHGLSLAECANKTGIPKETAKSRIYAAIRKLKKLKIIQTFQPSHSSIK